MRGDAVGKARGVGGPQRACVGRRRGLYALTGRRRPAEPTRIDAVAELLMACSCAPPDAVSADPTDACGELEIEQPESPGRRTARRVFTRRRRPRHGVVADIPHQRSTEMNRGVVNSARPSRHLFLPNKGLGKLRFGDGFGRPFRKAVHIFKLVNRVLLRSADAMPVSRRADVRHLKTRE